MVGGEIEVVVVAAADVRLSLLPPHGLRLTALAPRVAAPGRALEGLGGLLPQLIYLHIVKVCIII